MKKIIGLIVCLLVSFPAIARSITISSEQYQKILERLAKDKELFMQNDLKWNTLRQEIPQIEYKVTDNSVVVEKITIAVKDDNPLEYTNEFQVFTKNPTEGWFPLKLRLYGGVEVEPKVGEKIQPDVKLGLKFLGLAPLKVPVMNKLGLNALVGVNGFGFSVSVDLPKPVANTSIHLFYGYSYKLRSNIGVGASLNF